MIPAHEEEACIGEIVREIRTALDAAGRPWLESVIVADNGSSDRTAERAQAAGAVIVHELRRGYGSACLAALRHLAERPAGPPDIVVFADGDGSNDASELPILVRPIVEGRAKLVIGSRTAYADANSMTVAQSFGNRLATGLMNNLYGSMFSDLGPYRAVAWDALNSLQMCDPDYGWTMEMQLKAIRRGIDVAEVDVHNRARRAGRSKVTGTIRGIVGAGTKILWSLWRYR